MRQPPGSSTLAVMALGLVACSMNTRPAQPAVMAHTGVILPPEQLRLRNFQQAAEMAGIVEVAADDILARATELEVRQHALLWKANMITAIENSVIQFDPVISLLDLFALSLQADAFFRTGAGADAFGPQQDRARRATSQSISGMRALTYALAPDSATAGRGENAAQRWSDGHPIESLAFARQTMTATAASAITGGDMSAFAAVGRLDQNVSDLNARVAMLMTYMPKQIRWEAQMLTEQMLGRPQVDTVMASVASLTRSVERVTVVVESLPGLADWQRRAIMEGIAAERVEILRAVTAERVASFQAVADQVTRLLTGIAEERVAALKETEGILARTVQHSQSTVNASIDHLMWRVVQLAAGLVLVLAIGFGILVVVLWRRSAPVASVSVR